PAKVVGRSIGPTGTTIGLYHNDPMFNTMVYDVVFDDGFIKEYSANIIAENMMNQVEDEGFAVTHLKAIIDHWKSDNALDKDSAFTTTNRGVRRQRKTTHGWTMLVWWSDG